MVEVYAWGYGDILENALRGVAFLVTSGDYATWIRIAFTLAFAFFLVKYAYGGSRSPFAPITFLFTSYILWLAFGAGPKQTVVIHDIQTGQFYKVNNVPSGIAIPLGFFTSFEKSITEISETVFGVPQGIRYSDAGLFGGIAVLKGALDVRIRDPEILQSYNNFVIDCVVPSILAKEIDLDKLLTGNFWSEVSNVNPARVTTVCSGGNCNVVDCGTAYNSLNTFLSNHSITAASYLAKLLGFQTQTELLNRLTTASSYFLNYSGTAKELLKQQMAINNFILSSSVWVKASGLSPEQISVGSAVASSQFEAKSLISGLLASGYVPVIKGVLTVFFVASLPLVAILLIVGDIFLPRRILFTGLLTVFLWLSLWHFAEAILNMIVAVKTSSLLQSVYSGGNYIPLQSAPVLSNEVIRYVSMVGNYYWAIPFLTLLITGGFSVYTMNALAGRGAQAVAGAATVANDVALGNIRVGNVSENVVQSHVAALATMNRNIFTHNVLTENTTTRQVFRGNDGFGNYVDGLYQRNRFIGQISSVEGWQGTGVFVMEEGQYKPVDASLKIMNPAAAERMTGKNLMNAKVIFKEGAPIYIAGIDDSGTSHEYRLGENTQTFSLSRSGWEVEGYYKDGEEHITKFKAPVGVDLNSQLTSTIKREYELQKTLSETLRKSEGFSELSQEQVISAFNNSLELSTSKGLITEKERRWVEAFSKSIATVALEELSKGGQVRTDAEKLSSSEAQTMLKTGVKVESSAGLKVFGIGATAAGYGGVEGVWATREGWVVKTSDGQYYLYKYGESDKEAFEKAFKSIEQGENTEAIQTLERYAKQKLSAHQYMNTLSHFKQNLLDYTSQKAERLSKVYQETESQIASGKFNANAHFFQYVMDKYGLNLKESLDYMQNLYTNNPKLFRRLINEYIENEVKEWNKPVWAKDGPDTSFNLEGRMPRKFDFSDDIKNTAKRLYSEFSENWRINWNKQKEIESTMKSTTEYLDKLKNFEFNAENIVQLRTQRDELSKAIRNAQRDLEFKVKFLSKALDVDKNKLLELVKNPEKFEKYKIWYDSLPEGERFKYLNPKNLESLSELYKEIQDKKEILKKLDKELKNYKEVYYYKLAQDMAQGNYSPTVMGLPVQKPRKTETERKYGDKVKEQDFLRNFFDKIP